jgi:UDP-N-acetylmuramyl pentapeptide synthase
MDGALFIALCGNNFDAHDYVKQAQKMGAVGHRHTEVVVKIAFSR